MATIQQQATHWRDAAIARSEGISDAWEVAKAYAGRIAEWVLFGCMVANIVEMLPGVNVWPWFSAGILGIQVITLDIAGFGLASMGAAARRQGSNATASVAEKTGKWLIALMIVTLLVVAIGVLFPVTKDIVGYIEKGLILVRVVMTVVYGHVIHSLREASQAYQIQQDMLREELQQAQADLQDERQNAANLEQRLQAEITAVKNEQAEKINELSHHLAEMKAALETRTSELSHVQNLLSSAQYESSLKAEQYGKNELSWKGQIEAQVKAAREDMKAQMKAEQQAEMKALSEKIDALSRVNTELKAQVKGQVKAPVKPAKQLSSEEFDTKAFVFACLQENAEMKLSEIVMKAKSQGQELSEPTISRYRKAWRESSNESRNESSLG